MHVIDRQRGTLIGLAVGDALGAAVEFKPPGSFEPVAIYVDGAAFHVGQRLRRDRYIRDRLRSGDPADER